MSSDSWIPLPPVHGDRGEVPSHAVFPRALTIAISREAGARGGAIAGRVARRFGWQVVDHHLLEVLAQQNADEDLSKEAREWVEERLAKLQRTKRLSGDDTAVSFARAILVLGARGEVVIVGRGAGYLLPKATTLHVRVVAPRTDRIAYLRQWQRLTGEEATEQVRVRDTRRAEFLNAQMNAHPGNLYAYDLVLNSSRLGEEACAEIVAGAVRGKMLNESPDDVAEAVV